MKPATKTAFIVVLFALAVAISWWLSSAKKPTPLKVAATPASILPSITEPPPLPKPEDLPRIIQPNARTPYLRLKDPRWKDYEVKRKSNPSWEWETPIEFYGKVVDERNQPVAGASIDVAWSGTVEEYGGDGVGKRILTSDANGMFTLAGVEGKGITVRVSKDGYHVPSESNMQWFEYAGFWEPTFIEPDRNTPVVFHLVKRPVAEPTYRIGSRIFLEPPALETHLDLLSPTAQSTVPADLHVRITRPPGASYEKPFDWSVTIEGRNGAEIVETTDEFMLQAPADGYQPKLVRDYKNPTGNARQKVRFYVRSKGRKLYAAVDFEMAAYRRMNGSEPASIVISATVNPNDSPNVEYDPEKDIREMAKTKQLRR